MESNISGMEVGETTWDIESDHLTFRYGKIIGLLTYSSGFCELFFMYDACILK